MSSLLPDAVKAFWADGPGQGRTAEELMAEQARLIGEYARVWADAMKLPGRGALLDSLASEIAQFTRFTDPDEVRRRWKSAVTDVRDEWRTCITGDLDPTAVTAFYDQSEAYIFDLMAWHSLVDDNGPLAYVVALKFAEQRGCRDYLDFGSGVGSGAILFGRHGFSIALADISSNLLAFARARCETRGLAAAYIDLKTSGLPDASFDMVTAMDVWEHLTDPVDTASQIAKAIRPGGFLFGRFAAEPDENHPQHIVYDFEPTFRKLQEEGFVEVWRDEWLWGHQAFQKRASGQGEGQVRSPPVRIPFSVPARGSRPFDVAGFGLNSVDLLAVVAEYPGSNTKQRLQRFARLPGGEIATAMATCAKLGWHARYVGSFGDDDLGEVSRESLTAQGVDISAARTVAGATNQFAVILVDARSGERTVLWDRHPALTMDPIDVPKDAVTSGRLLIVDCHQTPASTRAARYAREAGIPTIIDVEIVRPGIADLLQNIDAIIAAEEFPTALTGHENLGRALEVMGRDSGASLACVTLGDAGSLAWCNGREIRTPPFQVDCVDSTGAGGAFRGAFAAGCLAMPDGDIEDVLTYANAVAALNCRALGARGGLPDAEEVERFMLGRPAL